jgi:hypothetical protein
MERRSSETWRMSGWVDANVNGGVTKSDEGREGPRTGWCMASG